MKCTCNVKSSVLESQVSANDVGYFANESNWWYNPKCRHSWHVLVIIKSKSPAWF